MFTVVCLMTHAGFGVDVSYYGGIIAKQNVVFKCQESILSSGVGQVHQLLIGCLQSLISKAGGEINGRLLAASPQLTSFDSAILETTDCDDCARLVQSNSFN